jgi:hypothetical protein
MKFEEFKFGMFVTFSGSVGNFIVAPSESKKPGEVIGIVIEINKETRKITIDILNCKGFIKHFGYFFSEREFGTIKKYEGDNREKSNNNNSTNSGCYPTHWLQNKK